MIVTAVNDCLAKGSYHPVVVAKQCGEDQIQDGHRDENPGDDGGSDRIVRPLRKEEHACQGEAEEEAPVVAQVDTRPWPVVAEEAEARSHERARQSHDIGLVRRAVSYEACHAHAGRGHGGHTARSAVGVVDAVQCAGNACDPEH